MTNYYTVSFLDGSSKFSTRSEEMTFKEGKGNYSEMKLQFHGILFYTFHHVPGTSSSASSRAVISLEGTAGEKW